jgi:fumarylacetoacetate (FAA) hydrolase
MSIFLHYWDDMPPLVQGGVQLIEMGKIGRSKGKNPTDAELLALVPFPTSCRDGYAFRQHVPAARRNRGLEMILQFDD